MTRSRPAACPVAPDSVHVWRGFRAPGRQPADFAAFLGSVFVPACALLQPDAGLRAYLPSLPASEGKPDSVPDQTALMFWATQSTYHDAFETLAVRAYTNLHGDAYGPGSSAQFPTALGSSLAPDQPCYLIDRDADWMLGRARHLVAGRPPATATQAFLASIYAWADGVRTRPPAGLEGALVCAGQSYVAAWLLEDPRRPCDEDPLAALAKLGQVWLDAEAQPCELGGGLWSAWPGLELRYPSCLNVQLRRPRGS